MVSRVQDEKSNLKVVRAELEIPKGGGDGMFAFLSATYPDGSHPQNGDRRIRMELENGTVEYLPFYSDEICISPNEVNGKTLNEAWDVFYKKDLAYIRG